MTGIDAQTMFAAPDALRVVWAGFQLEEEDRFNLVCEQFQLVEWALRAALAYQDSVGYRRLEEVAACLSAIERISDWFAIEAENARRLGNEINEAELSAPSRSAISTAAAPNSDFARQLAQAAVAEFRSDQAEAPRSLLPVALVDSAFAAAEDAEHAAEDLLRVARATTERIQDLDSPNPEFEVIKRARKRIAVATQSVADVNGVALGLLSGIPLEHEPLVVRLRKGSPVELVLAAVGGASGAVALFSHILDVQVKYRLRDEREQAERANLERRIAEDEAAARTIDPLRNALASRKSKDLPINTVTLYDSVEEALEDGDDATSLS